MNLYSYLFHDEFCFLYYITIRNEEVGNTIVIWFQYIPKGFVAVTVNSGRARPYISKLTCDDDDASMVSHENDTATSSEETDHITNATDM
jgi:hypothetical protein